MERVITVGSLPIGLFVDWTYYILTVVIQNARKR